MSLTSSLTPGMPNFMPKSERLIVPVALPPAFYSRPNFQASVQASAAGASA
jgi:hypothetical protein